MNLIGLSFLIIHFYKIISRFPKDKTSIIHTTLLHLPSQEAAIISRSGGNHRLLRSHDEETSEWIFCDICRKWFHARSINLNYFIFL